MLRFVGIDPGRKRVPDKTTLLNLLPASAGAFIMPETVNQSAPLKVLAAIFSINFHVMKLTG